jgi:hypothetical protein
MWCLILVSLSIGGVIERAWPLMLVTWVLLVVWSYGKSPAPVKEAEEAGQGFQVVGPQDESLECQEVPTAAVAS